MKTADTDRKSGGKEQLRQIDSPGKLIGLNANETNESLTTRPENQFDDLIRSDTSIGLIVGMKTYFYTCTQHCARASSAKPFRQANVLDGIADRTH